MVGATKPAGGGSVATDAGVVRGRALVTKSCYEAGFDRAYRPMCARWRSTAAIAAAVTASTICCREGGESAPGVSSMLVFATRGGTCRLSSRSRPGRRGCWLESLSEVPGGVARLAFPRPREGSSRRLSGGGGGVAGGRFGPIRTGWSCGVTECLADPSCAVWSAIGSLQKVAEVEDVVHHSVA